MITAISAFFVVALIIWAIDEYGPDDPDAPA